MEEGIIAKSSQHPTNIFDGVLNKNVIVQRAEALNIWARSLPYLYTPWPMDLPNPEIYYSAEEQFFIEKTNDIYLKAVTYLLNHELAHLLNNHLNTLYFYKQKGYGLLTQEEKENYKIIEGEADLFAREEMIDPDDDEKSKQINGLAILLAHCASLFAIKHPKDLIGNVHPDLDNRIFHSINFLNIQDQERKHYIFLAASICFNYFFSTYKIEIEKAGYRLELPEVEDEEDYFRICLQIIDDIKRLYEQ